MNPHFFASSIALLDPSIEGGEPFPLVDSGQGDRSASIIAISANDRFVVVESDSGNPDEVAVVELVELGNAAEVGRLDISSTDVAPIEWSYQVLV